MAGQAEWEQRGHGVLKRAPQQPFLIDVLKLNGDDIVKRLGPSADNEERVRKLLDGFQNVLCKYSGLDIEDVYYSGSFGRGTALNYKFDADMVVTLSDFNHDDMDWYKEQLSNAAQHFRRGVEHQSDTPFCRTFVVGGFVEVDLVITGDPDANCHNPWRYYSGAGSPDVDTKLLILQSNDHRFKPLVLLCKHWRNQDNRASRLSSFLVELFCKKVVEQSKKSVSILELLREFLTVLSESQEYRLKNPNRYNDRCIKLRSPSLSDYAQSTLNNRKYQPYLRPGNNYKCVACGLQRFTSASGAVEHLESGRCPHCPGSENARNHIYGFVSKHDEGRKLLNRMLTDGNGGSGDMNSKLYACTSCNKTFPKFSSLMNHMQAKHERTPRLQIGY
eukprot:TRINITY_DN37730_c0_g1_i1.p1 TRINITY_DN37730_c0_g1~~TRINITY_DN37730_c0_g1_i1.p1  ORF type:complete len:389 (+),score=48.22 TRINITY_DN37730_c0_g1_i1:134-1300(+)